MTNRALSDRDREEMLSYDSCLISDALERLGLPKGVAGIGRLATNQRIFGAAVTVKLGLFTGAPSSRHLGTAAIEAAEPGDVILVEHHARSDCAGWGGLLSTAAAARQISGVVIDGMARDIDESADLDFPVFARGATPVTARGKVVEVATNVPVDIGGVEVVPGDFVLADGSGVALIPRARFQDVLDAAREMIAFENSIRENLAKGLSVGAAMNESYERMLEAKEAAK